MSVHSGLDQVLSSLGTPFFTPSSAVGCEYQNKNRDQQNKLHFERGTYFDSFLLLKRLGPVEAVGKFSVRSFSTG